MIHGQVHLLAMAGLLATAGAVHAQMVVNPFHDPFVRATSGLQACPVPAPPTYSQQEVRGLEHERSQRGVSCWLDGRCRLHNGYLYDAEIVPRVVHAINYRGQFTDTSVWVLGQRRHVTLMGCVTSADQVQQLEMLASRIDDVEQVFVQLTVGAKGVVPYQVDKH